MAGLLIFDHPGSGHEITQRLFIGKGFEDFAPDTKIKAGERDEIDQKKRNDDREHEAELKRFINKKMFASILAHGFFPQRSYY